MGAASASQLMAAVESRELVSAVRSFADPNASRPTCLREEREQKAEQQLEHRGTIAKHQRQVHTTLDAGRRFTESCEGANGTMPNDSIAILTGATSIKEIEPRQLQRPLGRRSRLPT
jgi:hypothetical protein